MAGKNWQIEGKWAEFCNCNYGCPCETMAEPTYGHCTGLVAFKIDNGWCEDVGHDGCDDAAGRGADAAFVRARQPHPEGPRSSVCADWVLRHRLPCRVVRL